PRSPSIRRLQRLPWAKGAATRHTPLEQPASRAGSLKSLVHNLRRCRRRHRIKRS
ncbi:Hypothetical predicted protein, partial [Podarcis lilfordi]